MASDIEEFESAISLVTSIYKQLQIINPNNHLLSLIELTGHGFKPNKKYQEVYVLPYLKKSNKQLCLWGWAYENQFEAKIKGLLSYEKDLFINLKNEVSENKLIG